MTASGAQRSSLNRFEQASGFGHPEKFLEKLALRMGLLILVDAGEQHASECTSTNKSCMHGEHPKASAAVSKAVGCPRQTLAHQEDAEEEYNRQPDSNRPNRKKSTQISTKDKTADRQLARETSVAGVWQR